MGKHGTHQSRNTVFSTNCEISLFWHIQVVGWTQPCIPYQKDNLCILLTRKRCRTVWDDMSFFPHCLVKSITLDEVIIFSLLRTSHISIYCLKCRSRESTDDDVDSVTVVAFSCLLIRLVIHYSSNCWIPSGCYYEGIWLLCRTAGPVLWDIFFPLF